MMSLSFTKLPLHSLTGYALTLVLLLCISLHSETLSLSIYIVILHSNLEPRNSLMRMLACHLSAQNNWKVKDCRCACGTWKYSAYSYVRSRWCNILAQTDCHSRKTEVKKTINLTVARKGMLDREFLWLCPTISGSKLEYALNRIMCSL